jgi:hypothetical protein
MNTLSKHLIPALITTVAGFAQSFNSTSTGSDGTLEINTPGTVVFDPRTFSPPLNPTGNHIFHFRSIHIGKDVVLRLTDSQFVGPVFWLSQGPVLIEGTIELNGTDGERGPSAAGAGGYPGGAARMPGYGPDESYKPNAFLVPLVGGRGGDGGENGSAGAGGGALLIASSTSITISGKITANGGSSADGTGGQGGAIRLVAPVIDGSGDLSAKGGQPQGEDGRVRFEAFDNRFVGSLNDTPLFQGKPFGLFLPPNPPPTVRVVNANGVPLGTSELRVNQRGPVVLGVEARNVPLGTVMELQFFSEKGLVHSVRTSPLEGTLNNSHTRVEVALPAGITQCYVKATWSK